MSIVRELGTSVSSRRDLDTPGGRVALVASGVEVGGSWASSEAARRAMTGNRGRNTGPELALRSALFRMGARFRVDAPLPGLRRRADLLFPRLLIAVFVDGCFWHGCEMHFRVPSTNRDYWLTKVERNRRRDLDTNQRLADLGWGVVRVWEHEDVRVAAHRVLAMVVEARGTRPRSGSP
jgi:DNA mismatch endonuclease (patch repair protein)